MRSHSAVEERSSHQPSESRSSRRYRHGVGLWHRFFWPASAAAQVRDFECTEPTRVVFNFWANAGAMRRIGVPGAPPSFAGELGSWGLYQMTFIIPEIPSGLNPP